jgi:hypothetical protein
MTSLTNLNHDIVLEILLLLYNTDTKSLDNFYKINKKTYDIYHTYKNLLKRKHIFYTLTLYKYEKDQINMLINIYPDILDIIIKTLKNNCLNEADYWYLINQLKNKCKNTKYNDIYIIIKNKHFENLFDKMYNLILYPLTLRYHIFCNRHFNNNLTLYYEWLEENYIWTGKNQYYKALHGRITFN